VTLRAIAALVGAATLSVLGMGVYTYQRRVDPEVADHFSERLRLLLELNHRLPAEVMRVRSGIVSNYDALVQTSVGLERLHRELARPPDFLMSGGQAEVNARLEESERYRKKAGRALERFKREYAVLKNSLRFLPVAARSLDQMPDVGRTVHGLVRDVLLLQVWHDDRVLERVSRALDELAAPHAEAEASDDLALVLLHTRVVRERSPVVDEAVRTLVQGPGVQLANGVVTTYARHYRAALARSAADRIVLFALALFWVGATSAYVILRLRRNAEELAKTGAQLEQALAAQRELNDLKSHFVSMTSHEFRTPLSVVLSSAEMLAVYGDRWPTEKRASHLERIRNAALSTTRMLDSILLIGRSDAGMLEFQPAPLALVRLCDDVVEAATSSTGQPGRIERTGPAGEDVVVADEKLLRHVLENLLTNALKYSPPDKPVHFEVTCEDAGVRFEIRDEGIGISEEDLRHLFETFHRGRNVGKVAGTGLGLSIVKRAVDRHGGTVTVDSELGAGTRCTVHIPCARSAAA